MAKVAVSVVEVARAVLQEDSDRLWIGLTDMAVVHVSASDVREAADMINTLRKASGRSQATVKAQMPPELMPQMAR
ncbi:MAG: hypothetical protein R3C02_21775 [Planctomycetaceae bacterium]